MLGGGERHLRSLAAALVATGTPCTVVTRRTDNAWPAREVLDGIEVIRVGPAGRGSNRKFALVAPALRAVRHARRSFDVLVVRGTRVLGAPAVALARWLGKPVVLQPEVNGEFSGEVFTWGKSWARGPAGRLVLEAAALRLPWLIDADAVVAMSQRIGQEAISAGFDAGRVHWLPHGIDVSRFHPVAAEEQAALRRALGLEERTWIVYTGRLLRGKGLESLLDAFAQVHRDTPHTGLLLVGSADGQSLGVEEELRRQAQPLGAAVRFTGRVEAVERYLQAADLFAFPSENEALGLSLLEAGACGLASVATRTGGIVDVVADGVTGVLVAPGDTAALARALSQLVGDVSGRIACGQAAGERVRQRFDARRSLIRYRALFDEIARRGNGRGLRRAGEKVA